MTQATPRPLRVAVLMGGRSSEHDVFKHAEFCSMCGPKFCSMQISRHLGEERPKRIHADEMELVDRPK